MAPEGAPKRPKPRRTRPLAAAVCLVCTQAFQSRRIPPSHLRTHGLTAAQYARVYHPLAPRPAERSHSHGRGPDAPQAPAPTLPDAVVDAVAPGAAADGTIAPPERADVLALASPTNPTGAALVAAVGDALLSSPGFVTSLADGALSQLAQGPLRQRAHAALASVLAARMDLHGRALAALEAANTELRAPWRLAQGGPNGAPTPTRDVAAIADAASREVARGEDLVLRTARTILESERNALAAGTFGVAPQDRYTGHGEMTLAPPPDTTPDEREAMRILLSRLREGALQVQARRLAGRDEEAARAEAIDAPHRDAQQPAAPRVDPAYDI